MKILLSQINDKIKPYKISKFILGNIIGDLFSKLNACYYHELSNIVHKDKREKRLCEIVHTHCYNATVTTKKTIKFILKKHLTNEQYQKFGLKLLYCILQVGVDITLDGHSRLSKEIDEMNIDPKLEAIAIKVMDKMNLPQKNTDKYSNIIIVLMIIGIILSLVRIIQECNKAQYGVLNKNDAAKRMKEQIHKVCISRTFLNKWRLRRIIREKLNDEDYDLYATQLREAILDTGVELSDDESYALVEAIDNV